jgi:hypothetical protein
MNEVFTSSSLFWSISNYLRTAEHEMLATYDVCSAKLNAKRLLLGSFIDRLIYPHTRTLSSHQQKRKKAKAKAKPQYIFDLLETSLTSYIIYRLR